MFSEDFLLNINPIDSIKINLIFLRFRENLSSHSTTSANYNQYSASVTQFIHDLATMWVNMLGINKNLNLLDKNEEFEAESIVDRFEISLTLTQNVLEICKRNQNLTWLSIFWAFRFNSICYHDVQLSHSKHRKKTENFKIFRGAITCSKHWWKFSSWAFSKSFFSVSLLII